MNIFEKREAREKLEQEIREAVRNQAKDKRISRDFKKAQATGNVSFFLKKEAQSNENVKSALSQIDPSFQLSQQASVEYKSPINIKETQETTTRNLGQKEPSIETVLPPRPDNNILHVLCVQNTELIWVATEDCE